MSLFNIQIGSSKLQLKPLQAPRTPWTTNAMAHINQAAKSDRGFLVRHIQAGFWGVMALAPMNGDAIVSSFESIGKAIESMGRFVEGDRAKAKKQFTACMDKLSEALKYVVMSVFTAVSSLFVPDKVVEKNYEMGLARAPHPMTIIDQAAHAFGLGKSINIKV